MKQKNGNVSLLTPSKINQKKTGKTPVKVVPPKKHVEEEDDSEEEEDSGADVVADEPENSVEEEDEEDDDDDEDDDDEAEEDDDDEAEEDDDEEAVEVPIVKATPVKAKKSEVANDTGVPVIKTGAVRKDFPKDQVLIVKNLPKHYKQIDIVEVFAKYGTLHTIYNNHGPVNSVAYVAYTSPEEAEAAQAATDNIAKVKGATIRVSIQTTDPKKNKRDENKQKVFEDKKAAFEERKRKIEESKSRTVYIKNLKAGTTEDQVKAHFAECGEVESVKIFGRNQHCYGFVCFIDESSVPAATSQHNSVLNGSNIWVLKSDKPMQEEVKDPERTILLKNNKNVESIEPAKLESIFSNCGEIENYSILCKKNVLAFITFKDKKSAKKALKLNGTTAQGLELEVDEYKVKVKTTIFLQNVKQGVTEEDIRELFASTGPIESVNVHSGFATVKFEDVESFCKSFLLNESYLRGQMIFLEPFSEKKLVVIRNQKSNRKRPAPFNKGGNNKRAKTN